MSDLEKLLPEREVPLSTGETLTLRPFFFGQLPKAVKLLRPVTDSVRNAGIASFDGKTFGLAPDWALRIPQMMDEGGEALVAFVAFACNKPREWFDTLGADDGMLLTKAAFEVNGDFFVRKIAPLLGMAVEKSETETTGAPSSEDSYLPATAGET